MREYSECVACPCCGVTMQFVQTGSRGNLGEMQTFECKSCGLVATTEAAGGSMRPLIERRRSY
jgi:rubredoxin